MKKFFKEFKEFAMRGNVIDLAVGVIIGGAFQKIVTSIVNDLVMPLISLITKGSDFASKFVALDGGTYATIEEATEAGAAILTYGNFIAVTIDFIIMAFVIFLLIKGLNKLTSLTKKKEEEVVVEEAPTTKKCPFCMSEIAIEATRCPHCTSVIPEEEAAE